MRVMSEDPSTNVRIKQGGDYFRIKKWSRKFCRDSIWACPEKVILARQPERWLFRQTSLTRRNSTLSSKEMAKIIFDASREKSTK
jgi:hypothetical protein